MHCRIPARTRTGFPAVAASALIVSLFFAGCNPVRDRTVRREFPSLVLPSQPRPQVAKAAPKKPVFTRPRIYTRSDWGAAAVSANHDPMGAITRITVHHSGMGVEEEASIEDVKAELRLIQKSHKNHHGWADIGYHFVIDCSGRVWEGRPLAYQGAHAGNNASNKGNIGICVMGNYDLQKPTPQQVDNLQRLISYLMKKYNVPVSKVYTHREINDLYGRGMTECPGSNLQREVNAMRRRFAEAARTGD